MAQRVTGRNLDERVGLEGPRDELRELADAFDGMLARLDAVFSAQRRFVADASHELRTPLAAMRAEIEVLAADPNAAVADVEAATLVLRRQLARSEQLIEALLALARSEPELLNREPSWTWRSSPAKPSPTTPPTRPRAGCASTRSSRPPWSTAIDGC